MILTQQITGLDLIKFFRIIGCPRKNSTDLDRSSVENFTLINSWSMSKWSLIVNLSIDPSFVGIGALRARIFILKVQIFLYFQNRALAFLRKQILWAYRNLEVNEKKNEEMGKWMTFIQQNVMWSKFFTFYQGCCWLFPIRNHRGTFWNWPSINQC